MNLQVDKFTSSQFIISDGAIIDYKLITNLRLWYETTKVLGGELNFMYNYQGQGCRFDNHVLSAKYIYKF